MFVRRRNVTSLVSRRDSRVLDTLLHRAACADCSAIAELYRIVSADIRAQVEQTVPDPGDVNAVMAATFVEVWWLARGHAASHPDVRAWIRAIASRRSSERTRSGAGAGASPIDISGSHATCDAIASPVQDETTALMYAALVNGSPVPRRFHVPRFLPAGEPPTELMTARPLAPSLRNLHLSQWNVDEVDLGR
jgi:hypothetical protein